MNILYIAYSCAPNSGSENRIGWSVPLEMAKRGNNVSVITKEEHRQAISNYMETNRVANLRFYYADIPQIYKRMFKGFLYSARLNIWHGKAMPMAERICKENDIQVIHQITPIEIRAIGDYGRIAGIKFVAGSLGGGIYTKRLEELCKRA